MHIGTGPSHIEENNGARLVVRAGEGRFELTNDIWIERLDEELAAHIQEACEPPHYNFNNVGHDRHLYAFVRQLPAPETSRYEGMSQLIAAVALSRLIRPTSMGTRYCAQVVHFGLKDSPIWAIQYRSTSPDVFISGKDRDWLSIEDAEELRMLMPWLSPDKRMHDRVHRAYWYQEYAMRSYYLDARLTHVVSGIEALINTGEKDNSWQFSGSCSTACRRITH